MTDAPEKKRRKLTSALREAIGAHTQKTEENIEKPIYLALISDNKSAQDLLNKIQASRRPQAVLEATLKICEEKKCEAHVEEAFLSIFQKHFSVLGIDSAIACWKLLEEHLNKSESSNEIAIACEFIGTANLLGHGFGKLFQNIKSGLPIVIRNSWNRVRKVDALTLSYSFAMLLVAENMYGDSASSQSQSLSEFWKTEILTEKSIKKDFGMRMISALAENNESIAEAEISDDQIDFLAKVFLNHIEFFFGTLSASNFSQLLVKVIETHLEKNQLKSLAARIRSAEISITPNLYYALISVTRSSLELSDSEIVSIESLETLKLKEVAKFLPSVCEVQAKTNSTWKLAKKLENLLEFIEILIAGNGSGSVGEDNSYLSAFSLLLINLSIIFDNSTVSERILKQAPKDVIDKLAKASKGLEGQIPKIIKNVKKQLEEENAPAKYSNKTAAQAIEGLEATENTSVSDAISLLQDVHTLEVKKEVFDAVVKFVEEIPGGEGLEEIKLFKLIVGIYGGSPLESLALQVICSRLAADGWMEIDRTPGTEQSEESWFTVLVELIDLLDFIVRSAKNSIIKSFTALFCQLFSQLLKNTQKFARNSSSAVLSRTLTPEATTLCVLRRHKLIQDVARLVDAMKRNESYFAMLTASIIGDAVFYGSDSILAMSKLHSLADKNASALLATNLPAVERTRYKKFLSTITRASKRVY